MHFGMTFVTWDVKAREILLEEGGLKVVMEREVLQLNAMAMIACDKLWLRLQTWRRFDHNRCMPLARHRHVALVFGEPPTRHVHSRRTSTSMMDLQGSSSIKETSLNN